MRVLISAKYHGGAGGAERALFCILAALNEDDVDVVITRELGGPLAAKPKSTRMFTRDNWRWTGAEQQQGLRGLVAQRLLNPLRRGLASKYDVHYRLGNGADLSSVTKASVRLWNPAGGSLQAGRSEDYVFAMEAPDNASLVPEGAEATLLPPPFVPLARPEKPIAQSLPNQFLLTVFNPYHPVKGVDDLSRVAEALPLPLVWCHSARTLRVEIPESLAAHPNIIHVDDPTQMELRYLYGRCDAYVSFSRREGFGWAIADAIALSRAVVARESGILSFPESRSPGVFLVGDEWDFDWSQLKSMPGEPTARDMSWLSAESFRNGLAQLVRNAARS